MISGHSYDGLENPLCDSVPSVSLWFKRLLESIGVNASEAVVPWSRGLLTVAVTAL